MSCQLRLCSLRIKGKSSVADWTACQALWRNLLTFIARTKYDHETKNKFINLQEKTRKTEQKKEQTLTQALGKEINKFCYLITNGKRGTHLSLISSAILWKSAVHRYGKYLQSYNGTQAKWNWVCIYVTCRSSDCAKLICQPKTFPIPLLPWEGSFEVTLRATRTACVFDFSPTVAEPCFTASMAYSIWWIRPYRIKSKVIILKLIPYSNFQWFLIFRPLTPPSQQVHLLHHSLILQPTGSLNYLLEVPHH